MRKRAKKSVNHLILRGKKFRYLSMEHPIHATIRNLILTGDKSREEIEKGLEISKRTLVKRLKDCDWTLSEVIALEALFSVKLLAISAENSAQKWIDSSRDLKHPSGEPAGYKINIQIDPDAFKPQDLDELNKELTERMIERYRKRNGNG